MKIVVLSLVGISLWMGAFACWIEKQISEDLAIFTETGIKQSEIQAVFEEASIDQKELMYVKICNNQVSFSSIRFYERSQAVQGFFIHLANKYKLPDIEFVVALGDSFDALGPFPCPSYSVPIFVFAKHRLSKHNVLIPDFEALRSQEELFNSCCKGRQRLSWSQKKPIVFWRGAMTGGSFSLDTFKQFPRVKLVLLSQQHPDWLDAGFTIPCQPCPFVVQSILEQSKGLRPFTPIEDHFNYKYLIDIDGNSCTYSRCRWILLSNSTLLKSASENIQWYYKAMKPYEHYVPVREDLSDLQEVYQWLINHDDEAEQIANEGMRLAETLFSQSAIEEYVVFLLQEYSKLYQPDLNLPQIHSKETGCQHIRKGQRQK